LKQYYLRTRPAVGAIQFTVSAETLAEAKSANAKATMKAASVDSPVPSPQIDMEAPPKSVAPMAVSGTGAGADTTPIALKTRDVLASVKNLPQKLNTLSLSPTAVSPSPSSPAQASEDGEEDITYEEAMKRKEQREYEQEKLLCSLTNKEACIMCSGEDSFLV